MPRTQVKSGRPSQPIKRLYIMNPAKGLDNLVSESLIDQREASDLLNISFEESGIIQKRDGFSSVGSTMTGAQLLTYYYSEAGHQLIAIEAGVPKIYTSGVWTALPGGITMAPGRPFINATLAGANLFFWDKTNGGVQYDGATCTQPGTMPKGEFSIYNNGLHVVSGVPGQPSRVYVSQGGKPALFTRGTSGKPSGTVAGDGWPDNATDVPGATVFADPSASFTIDVSKNDGFKVTGLCMFQGSYIIFKENAIYQLTFDGATSDSTSAKLELITRSIGCVSHRTITYVENDVYFLSRRGVFVLGNEQNYYTAIRTNELSARIAGTIKAISPAGFERTHAIYSNNRYMLSAPISNTYVNRVITYDRRYQAWSLWDTIAPRSILEYIDDSNVAHTYFIQDTPLASSMKEIIPGQYNDDGAAINAFWVSGALDAGAVDITKRFVDLGLVIRRLNGTLSVTILADNDQVLKDSPISATTSNGYGYDLIGDEWMGGTINATVSTVVKNEPYRFAVKRNSRTLKFTLSNSAVNESFAVLGYIIGYYPYSYYKFNSTNKIY